MLYRNVIKFKTKKNEIKDISLDIRNVIEKSGIRNGICHIYFMGTTGAIFVNENDRMMLEDFKKMINEIIPKDKMYMHPSNSYSHLRALLTCNDKTVPISEGKLLLGTWQSVMFADFDTTGRNREVVVTIIGD